MTDRRRPHWKFLFSNASTAAASCFSPPPAAAASCFSPPPPPPPPPEPLSRTKRTIPKVYQCPISAALMGDPVMAVQTGETFERAVIEACWELDFIPPPLSSSIGNFSSSFCLVPNDTLKSAIRSWCDSQRLPRPLPVSQDVAHRLVQRLRDRSISISPHQEEDEEEEEEEERPSSSTISFFDPLEEEILMKLKDETQKESGLNTLHRSIKESRDRKISLCTPRIISAILPLLDSAHSPSTQIKATSAIASLSIAPSNRAKIVRWTTVKGLVNILENGHVRARGNAARSILRLALDESNKIAIGCFGAIPALLDHFYTTTQQSLYAEYVARRDDAGIALYHLTSLCSTNASKLAKSEGALWKLLAIAVQKPIFEEFGLQRFAMLIIFNLAGFIDTGAVEVMLEMLKEGAGKDEDCCLALMYEICRHKLVEFRETAVGAGAEVVLAQDKEGWGDVGRKMAKKMLQVIRREDYKNLMPVMMEIEMDYEEESSSEEEDEEKFI